MFKDPSYTCTLVFPNNRRIKRAGVARGYIDKDGLIALIKHPFGEDVKVENLKMKDKDGKDIE